MTPPTTLHMLHIERPHDLATPAEGTATVSTHPAPRDHALLAAADHWWDTTPGDAPRPAWPSPRIQGYLQGSEEYVWHDTCPWKSPQPPEGAAVLAWVQTTDTPARQYMAFATEKEVYDHLAGWVAHRWNLPQEMPHPSEQRVLTYFEHVDDASYGWVPTSVAA